MADLDTAKKRASAIDLGMPWAGRPYVQIDGSDAEDAGERLAAAGLYALESEEIQPSIFVGALIARAAFVSGLYAIVGNTNAVKPTPRVVVKTTTWRDMVKFSEGPTEFSRRNRFVAYRFGGGRGPSRQFWDG